MQAVKEKGAFTEIEHFCKYLDGLWLEHYVLQQVKNIADRNSIKDYGLNFQVPLLGTQQGFEFDVAFTRGYQLFAMSVSTTSKRDLCKNKLFEAYLRARQMGGDEARVALICCTNEPDTLKAEVAVLDDKKIAVFGRDDLTDLASKIEDWIKQNDKDAK
ncbi:Card1-like endonuclease domain-containing protein [Microcoleus sp. LAD1_D3]|uniref:Card1-like endonuclease domain-containing protein n=1 Tax=Microcoleus sp. LAD1_D3 TaxID=2819365 RepID=UPI002FD677FF